MERVTSSKKKTSHRKKLKSIATLLFIESVIVVFAGIVSIFVTSIPLSFGAKFLGIIIIFNLYLAWKGIQEEKRGPISEGPL